MPFRSKNTLRVYNYITSGQNTLSGHTLSGLDCTFGIEFPFGTWTPFWESNVLSRRSFLSVRRCPFGPKRPCMTRTSFQAKNALFRPRLPYRFNNSLSYCEFPIGLRVSFIITKNDNQPYTASETTSSHNRHCGISLLIYPVCAGYDKPTWKLREDGSSWISPWVTHGIRKAQQGRKKVRVSSSS